MQTLEHLRTALGRLVCPVCHGQLQLGADPESGLPSGSQGSTVCCAACHRCYPLEDGIPVLLAARAHIPGDPASK